MRRAHPREVGTLTGLSPVAGTTDPAFAAVRDAFAANFTDHDELGAALCVYSHGRPVVDLWGGNTGSGTGSQAWTPDTLVNAFSVGKGLLSLVTALCVHDGLVDYGDTIVSRWPAFGAHGKSEVTLRDALGHRAALPAVRRPLHGTAMYEWDTMTDALAAEDPWWVPGSTHGYHVNTFGFLVGEVLRRATGLMPGDLTHSLVRERFGADTWFGVPHAEHHRIAELRWNATPTTPTDTTGMSDHQLMYAHAHVNPPGLSGVGHVNTPRWRSAQMPSTNLHASARGVARAYEGFTGLVSAAFLSDVTTEVSCGTDEVLQRTTRFGAGFQLPVPERGFGPNPEAFGHYGAGGSMGFHDPVAGITVGYVMNQMGTGWQNPRNRALIAAVYSAVGG